MTTVPGLIAGFELDQRRRNLSRLTIERRSMMLRKLTRAQGPLLELGPEDIAGWLDVQHNGRLVADSRRAYMVDLKAFYSWAVKRGHIDRNPFEDLVKPEASRRIPRPIRDDELSAALAEADPRMRCWLLLGALAGLRSKEIAGVAAEHLLWHEIPPLLLVADGKGRKQRLVPIAEELEAALKAAQLPRAGFLFPRPYSAVPVTAAYVSHTVSAYLHTCGSPATTHQLRHWFGTKTYRATKDIRAVQELLGHSSPQTTSIYAQFSPGESAAVVRGLRAG